MTTPPSASLKLETEPALDLSAESRNRIPGDLVYKATADLPDHQRNAIRRLHAHYAENNLSLQEVGALISRSPATIGLIFRGKYEAKLDDTVSEIEAYFELEDRRAQGRKLPFIPTRLSERIWKICDGAFEFQRMAFIVGDGQVGKTEACEQYAAKNPGRTVYTRMPSDGLRSHFIIRAAQQLRIPSGAKTAAVAERIIAAFDSRMLWIIDEVHHCLKESRGYQRLETIEFIREVFDLRKCGVVLIANSSFQKALHGPMEKFFQQTVRRGMYAYNVPHLPTSQDLAAFAAAYGLPPAAGPALEVQTEVIQKQALGKWLTLLRIASKMAAQKKQKLNWSHVQIARDGIAHLEGR